MTASHVAILDIGKTNAKLALVDTSDLSEIAVLTRPNKVRPGPPYPHVDVDVLWSFFLDALSRLHRTHRIDTICVTTHGAAGALIAADGTLVAPILDYEHPGPESTAKAYAALRPAFFETGSPALSLGLNLGAQIHWQFARDPGLQERTAHIVTYPQYWGFRLTGALACDVSSLGAHTDLWNPFAGTFSSLARTLDITDKIAPPRRASDLLGPLLPAIAAQTGLPPDTPVLCGIHDSNASLLPHILRRTPPFSVVSTGTWVIPMTIGGADIPLDPTRDTLVNVNALGNPVPSARFMGGREYEILCQSPSPPCDADTLAAVAQTGPLLMPAIITDCGPFQGRQHHWIGPEPAPGTPEHTAAVGFYLALMTAESLSLTGHRGPVVVEGPFARNTAFCTMLGSATGCPVEASESATGTSQGAALLAMDEADTAILQTMPATTYHPADPLIAYADRWRAAVNR